MYKNLGIFGDISLQSIRYMDDMVLDLKNGYKLGFTINLLPVIRVNNTYMGVSVVVGWLFWQFTWYHSKMVVIDYDIQGNIIQKHRGIRYFLSLRWLFSKI